NMNRSYISSVFKEKYGISPKHYLLNHRMNMAATLLQQQNRVNATAAAVGYSDTFIFSKAFKNYYGVSPSEYSKKYR
ncbi:MAG: helix-turn-helix transcriptional regulator, partial [Clostridia bacterium]|nr:helix-turn-helix transcriptional regulator [Clostridia bacterium]